MSKIIFNSFLLILLSLSAKSQSNDYKEYRKKLTKLSCTKLDSLELFQTKSNLEHFDTTIVSKNMDMYYNDLAWCYYRIYMYNKDEAFNYKMVESYEKSLLHNPKGDQALWGLSYYYFGRKDCEKGLKYMALYKENVDSKYWRNNDIEKLLKKCD